jgi:hypothetical protein
LPSVRARRGRCSRTTSAGHPMSEMSVHRHIGGRVCARAITEGQWFNL